MPPFRNRRFLEQGRPMCVYIPSISRAGDEPASTLGISVIGQRRDLIHRQFSVTLGRPRRRRGFPRGSHIDFPANVSPLNPLFG